MTNHHPLHFDSDFYNIDLLKSQQTMAAQPLLNMQYKAESSAEPAGESREAAEEMDPEAEEMEMTYEEQRMATIRYAPSPHSAYPL